jgi:cell division protein FtsQ
VNAKTTIRKVLFIALWLCIGGGMLTLLLAAISQKNKRLCKDYTIAIKGVRNNFFIDKKDIEELLIKKIQKDIKGQPVSSFSLHELEQILEHNDWIDEAELYFDNRDVLHISVTEREPVARIFTTGGNSFYIDSLGTKMPLSEKLSARVPMFTNFPDKKILSEKDSSLLSDVRVTANFIINDPFWMSQVAQIDISPEKKLEMFPVVGNHIVKLGNSENIAEKFRRLMVFYKQVLSKTGFDKYKLISVEFKGQVVATNFTGETKVDSVRLKRNLEKLLQETGSAQNDTVISAIQVTGMYTMDVDSVLAPVTDLPIKIDINPEKDNNPNPVKSSLQGKEVKKQNKPEQTEKKKPKAVMPKKPAEDANGGYN